MYKNTQQDYNSANKVSDSITTSVLTLSIAKLILLKHSEDFLLCYEHITCVNRNIFPQNNGMCLTTRASRMYHLLLLLNSQQIKDLRIKGMSTS